MKSIRLQCTFALLCLMPSVPIWAKPKPHPHYRIVLPEAYVGWVQVIFQDDHASALPHDLKTLSYTIAVPTDGIARTSDMHVNDAESVTEVISKKAIAGADVFTPVSPNLLLPGYLLGGFTLMGTCEHGPGGGSWFFFVGRPDIRQRFPEADWLQYVQDWHKQHGKGRVMFDGNCPVMGNLQNGN